MYLEEGSETAPRFPCIQRSHQHELIILASMLLIGMVHVFLSLLLNPRYVGDLVLRQLYAKFEWI